MAGRSVLRGGALARAVRVHRGDEPTTPIGERGGRDGSMSTDREFIERAERASMWAWPPRETFYVSGWILQAGEPSIPRINSAKTLRFEQGADLDRAIERVEGWYAERDRTARFQIADRVEPEELDRVLEDRGYERVGATSVWWRPLEDLPPADPAIEIETRPRAAVMNAIADPNWDETVREEHAAMFERIRRPLALAVAFEGEFPVAGGACVVVDDLAIIHSVFTQPMFRGRGHGKAILARLLGWARAMDGREALLHLPDGNEIAETMVRRFDFTRRYGYAWRRR